MTAVESPFLTINNKVQMMLLRMGFNQTVSQKLVKDLGIDTLQIIDSHSDEDISVICEVIRRPGGLSTEGH